MKVSIIPWIVRKLKLCFALVEDGDTASQNIAQGKFVIWKGVCCKAASAITAGETLSGTNLPAISGGALNDIGSDISTLNSKITQKNIGAFGSLSNIESALVTQLNSMTVGSSQAIFFTTTASGISVFNVWSGYVGTIFKTDTNRCVVDVYPHGTEAKNIIGYYVNSTWTWSSLYDNILFNNYTDVSIGNITLNSSGYYDIMSFKPSGKIVTMSSIATWGSTSPVSCFSVAANGNYVFGSANQTINDLKVRFFYKR